jgi:glycine/D-amino acid oxidase-like deaminating enzyme
MARKTVVIGGGFVGLSSALHLQRIGRQVTLVDSGKVGSAVAASYGNAGTMAAYANVPVNSPGLLRKLPSMLLDASSPLSIKPSAHLASMLPWASLFAWNCRPAAVERTAAGLGALLSRAESGYEAVWKQAGVDIDLPMGADASADVPGQRERPYAVRHGQGRTSHVPQRSPRPRLSGALLSCRAPQSSSSCAQQRRWPIRRPQPPCEPATYPDYAWNG